MIVSFFFSDSLPSVYASSGRRLSGLVATPFPWDYVVSDLLGLLGRAAHSHG